MSTSNREGREAELWLVEAVSASADRGLNSAHATLAAHGLDLTGDLAFLTAPEHRWDGSVATALDRDARLATREAAAILNGTRGDPIDPTAAARATELLASTPWGYGPARASVLSDLGHQTTMSAGIDAAHVISTALGRDATLSQVAQNIALAADLHSLDSLPAPVAARDRSASLSEKIKERAAERAADRTPETRNAPPAREPRPGR